MTQAQKVIKYLAIALAIFIIVNIISAILFGLYFFSNFLGLKKSENVATSEMHEITTNIEINKVDKLKIDLAYSTFRIQKGDTLKVEANSSSISCKQNNNKLEIIEKGHNWFSNKNSNELIIYIPENTNLKDVEIQAGAAEIYIDELETNKLDFELGAGKVQIGKLNVFNEADMDCGAGKVEILSGTINDLDLDAGTGKISLNSKLTGKSDIDAGIGTIDIDLTDSLENYTMKVSKGIGTINMDGKELSDNEQYGNGESYIKIDGGVGSINIK